MSLWWNIAKNEAVSMSVGGAGMWALNSENKVKLEFPNQLFFESNLADQFLPNSDYTFNIFYMFIFICLQLKMKRTDRASDFFS